MQESWDVISQQVKQLPTQLHPFYVIAGKPGTGKTAMARRIADEGLGVYVNLSFALAQYLLRQQDIDLVSVHDLLMCCEEIYSSGLFVFDNIELLMTLKLQVVPLFQEFSRYHPAVVIWPGTVEDGIFQYSMPNLDDYYYFRDMSVLVTTLEHKSGGNL
ncbi:BREX-3 system P-loop-containing protein BrxF [Sulfobacillus thermosulfidooxidans]|uniref:BREX-3 system P-loop-containing protein BrxF n=1 Tax=Sulfobacillus thermosulfidooxidans TaxID=28034 RepID=UPI0006B4101C|nr:BREX-3 system P-loop-containing protein BrxF [Sulfobacillus thermosulfidooxidans]